MLIETLYQNIINLRTSVSLKEWLVKEGQERYQALLDEFNALKAEHDQILQIANHRSPSAE